MTLAEKIGQLSLVNSIYGNITEPLRKSVTSGQIGGILNEVDIDTINELQRIAVEDSRLGIPLLAGRDVIHGFKTIFPIPLGLASTWNPSLVENSARIAAIEASASGINWTFAPMIDISRDPRWGRIAESFGEDTYLSGVFARAMVRGFQGDDLSRPDSIAACAKHFAGYGACEAGKDYNTTNIPENELRNIYLPPFKDAIEAGVVSLMTSFGDLNGIPASANEFLLRQILRDEWNFDGFVVSDWESISQLSVHGLTANDKESAYEAANAGVDMEMTSKTYADHMEELIEEGKIALERLDQMVTNILLAKFRLGLFDNPFTMKKQSTQIANSDYLASAKQAAIQSCVLLENKNNTLPLEKNRLASIAVIGPLAADPYEQLGTWIFDGSVELSQTPLQAINAFAENTFAVNYCKALETTRSKDCGSQKDVMAAVDQSDVVVLFLGEESILSGEAHSRADISLPGCQESLIQACSESGKPVILVVFAGRPLILEKIRDQVDAILWAWHPGNMAGPAIVDLLFGVQSPSGKLPVCFPRVIGQIPIYYNHKNTGRPGDTNDGNHIDKIKAGAPQHSTGDTSFHLDTVNSPLYPFGYGLSYTEFSYSNLHISNTSLRMGDLLEVHVDVTNTGQVEAEEVVQLYIRDLVGSVTRPVKELKGFKRIRLVPGECKQVSFTLTSDDLAFYNRYNRLTTEPGTFRLMVGGNSNTDLQTEFEIIE